MDDIRISLSDSSKAFVDAQLAEGDWEALKRQVRKA
jgi:hypothetical protein